ADGRITLAELIDNLGDIKKLLDAPSLTGGGQIPFTVDVSPNLPGLDDSGIQLVLKVNDLGDPFSGRAPNVTLDTPGLGGLLDFKNLDFNFANVIAGLKSLDHFLSQFEAFGFLNDPLPLVHVSVHDLIAIADRFGQAVDAAQANPAGSLQLLERKLEEAF